MVAAGAVSAFERHPESRQPQGRAAVGSEVGPWPGLRLERCSSEEITLGRFFFAFPRGWAGAALLLLRAVPGAAVLAEGIFYFTRANSALAAWFSGCLALAAGALLLAGFLTPIAATVMAAGTAAVGFSLLPASSPNFFDSRSSLILAITMLVAIACLGPGAFSVDARVFGRREIIIPPHHE